MNWPDSECTRECYGGPRDGEVLTVGNWEWRTQGGRYAAVVVEECKVWFWRPDVATAEEK